MLHSNLSTQHVCIVGDGSMFEEGISQLLSFETNLQISGFEYKDDSSFLEDITQNQPDVIVLTESAAMDSAHILELLFSTPSLTALHIVIIRLSTSLVDVYEMPKRLVITKRAELVAVVQGNFQQDIKVRHCL